MAKTGADEIDDVFQILTPGERLVVRRLAAILRVALGSVFLMRAGLTLYPVLDDELIRFTKALRS